MSILRPGYRRAAFRLDVGGMNVGRKSRSGYCGDISRTKNVYEFQDLISCTYLVCCLQVNERWTDCPLSTSIR